MTQQSNILEVAHEFHNCLGNRLREQIRRGQQNCMEHGRWIGLAPMGYRNVRRKGEARVEVNPRVAPLIQQAFYLAAEGKHSPHTIRHILKERGLRSRRGKGMTTWVMIEILTNPFYMGKMRYKGELYT